MAWGKTGNIRGISWLGAWSAVTAYTVGQGVSRLGSSYACMAANTNVDPSTDVSGKWLLIASKGDTGATGATPALSSATPQPLGTAAAGAGTNASRDNHVHSSSVVDLIASNSFKRGSGAAAGTNYIQVYRTIDGGNLTAGTWADMIWNAISGVSDDSMTYSSALITLPVAGMYLGVATTNFWGSQSHGIRCLTGSSVIGETASVPVGGTVNSTAISLPILVIATAGMQIKFQVRSDLSTDHTLAHAAAAPCIARIAQIG